MKKGNLTFKGGKMSSKESFINLPGTQEGDNLLILGNGFDLTLEVNSKYEDFYKSDFFKNSDSTWKEIIEYLTKDNADALGWVDIETAIQAVLIGQNGICNNPSAQDIWQTIVFMRNNELLSVVQGVANYTNSLEYIRNTIEHEENEKPIVLILSIYKLINQKKSADIKNDFKNFIDYVIQGQPADEWNNEYITFLKRIVAFLFDELRGLEADFVSYLKREIDKNNDYKELSNQLVQGLVFDTFYSPGNGEVQEISPLKIIDFNYTPLNTVLKQYIKKPNGTAFFENDSTNFVNHIHGELDKGNIIFGIDNHAHDFISDNVVQQMVLPFTKVSRKLRIISDSQFKIRKGLSNIIFFGHSLGEADFSYFKYIFDEVDLFNSDVHLIFKYRIYDEKAREKIFKDQFDSVEKLIRRYQDTSLNSVEKYSLFEKLIMENRLVVKEVVLDD